MAFFPNVDAVHELEHEETYCLIVMVGLLGFYLGEDFFVDFNWTFPFDFDLVKEGLNLEEGVLLDEGGKEEKGVEAAIFALAVEFEYSVVDMAPFFIGELVSFLINFRKHFHLYYENIKHSPIIKIH